MRTGKKELAQISDGTEKRLNRQSLPLKEMRYRNHQRKPRRSGLRACMPRLEQLTLTF
jgi:hypothetical protein